MRRTLQLIGQIFCLLSLLTSAAAIVLWARSYRVGETWHFNPTPAAAADAAPLPAKPDSWLYQYHVACGDGQLQLVRRNMATSDVKQLGYRRADPPDAALTLPGHTDFSGAAVVRTARLTGSGAFHYDESLERFTGGTKPVETTGGGVAGVITIESYTELTTPADRSGYLAVLSF